MSVYILKLLKTTLIGVFKIAQQRIAAATTLKIENTLWTP